MNLNINQPKIYKRNTELVLGNNLKEFDTASDELPVDYQLRTPYNLKKKKSIFNKIKDNKSSNPELAFLEEYLASIDSTADSYDVEFIYISIKLLETIAFIYSIIGNFYLVIFLIKPWVLGLCTITC